MHCMFQAWTRETGVALFFFICKIIKIKPSDCILLHLKF